MKRKYNRTPHLEWSKGCTSDDKKAEDISALIGKQIIVTEKLDGGNCSIEVDGVFARSHSGQATHPSFDRIKALQANIHHLLPGNHQFFGENMFAKHSIFYDKLPGYFLLFAVREFAADGDKAFWYSWEETEEWANKLGLPTVPVLWTGSVHSEKDLEKLTSGLMKEPSALGKEREGLVIRTASWFPDKEFSKCVSKIVRENHVKTNSHWSHQSIVQNLLSKR